MSKLRLLVVMVFSVALVPALATAGNGELTGSCLYLFDPNSPGFSSSPLAPVGGYHEAQCVDGLTEAQCAFDAPEGSSSFDWSADMTCEERDLPFDWDGSCLVPDSILGDICVLLYIEPDASYTSQELCEEKTGYDFYGDLACGGAPVPTAPRAAMALMVLILLAGSLTLLAFKGSSA